MHKVKSAAKSLVRRCVHMAPGGEELWDAMSRAAGANTRFTGWGMLTTSAPPWLAMPDEMSKSFLRSHNEICGLLARNEFVLQQFSDAKNFRKLLDQFMWRHYIIHWSATNASRSTRSDIKALVECGVCDGMTAFFAMKALDGRHPYQAYLYDAWGGMKSDNLLPSEKHHVGSYEFLQMERTAENLIQFKNMTAFIKGYIPQSFESSQNPEDVSWLHIDLNSAHATASALEFFFDRLLPGGAIVFDDSGWPDYIDTKHAVDSFFVGKEGALLPLPTGQAIYFKS